MTLVDIHQTVPDGEVGNPEAPATGYQTWEPWGPGARRRAEDPPREIREAGFRVNFLPAGVTTIEVAPTDGTWAWAVREYVKGTSPTYRVISVPDVARIDFRDCPQVDPRTLGPMAAPPDPIWVQQLAALTDEIAAAQGHEDAAELAASQAAGSASSAAASATAAASRAGAADASATAAASSAATASAAQAATEAVDITVGTVTTGAPDTPAAAAIFGTAPNFTLDLTIPRGDTGETGPANSLSIGTVTTGAAGSSASASITGTAPDQTLDLTIPRGDTGNPTAYELRGTGMPNGVVTAPPGTYYTDTVGSAGAWRWLKKSGTGNTGWAVVHGDTGWRQCRHDLAWADCFVDGTNQVWQGGTPISLIVRRTNERITMKVMGIARTRAAAGAGLAPLPSDWRPPTSSQFMGYNSALQSFRLWAEPTGVTSLQGPVSTGAFTYDIRFEVSSSAPWLTTLPGTPA